MKDTCAFLREGAGIVILLQRNGVKLRCDG